MTLKFKPHLANTMDNLVAAVVKQLNHHSDANAVGCEHVRRKEACLIQACTLAPPGKYDCIRYMRHECRFMEYLQTEYSSNSTTLNANYD